MNLAAIWNLPVVFVCENNHYAQSSPIEQMVAQPKISRRGEAYGVVSHDVDGMDVMAVYAVANEAIERARSGQGPSLVVADTYRYLGHMAGDTEMYRLATEVDTWRAKDPIGLLAHHLTEAGLLDADSQEQFALDATYAVDEAERFARTSPPPSVDLAFTDVYAPLQGAIR